MADELVIQEGGDAIPRSTGILWGPPKCGKTTLLMSLPGKKLIANVDPDGWNAIAHRDDFKVIDFTPYEADEIVRFAQNKLPTLIEEAEDFGPGDSFIFDSISSFNQAALVTAVKNKIGAGSGFTPSLEAPGLAAYGARTQYLVNTFAKLLKVTRRKGMHCWFTAHEDTPEKDKQGNMIYVSILMSDNAINQTGLAISEIWYMFDNDTKRMICIRPTRARKPMGSRMFRMDAGAEFQLKYDPDKGNDQPHSLSTWWNAYIDGGKKKLELPK